MTFLNDDSLADCAIMCALNSEMLLQSVVPDSDDKNEDLESLYLKKMKSAIEQGVMSKIANSDYLNSLFDDAVCRELFHRKIWLTLGCPRIDDIGGKIHNEFGLESRV